MTTHTFPDGFLIGAATAGHQIEGDNVHSDTWFLEQQQPSVFREKSGKACNSYELWESDLDLVQSLGLKAYRFSVEWARIEPEEGSFDETALDHYEAIVDGCHARGIAPIVTLNHFTAPHWFAARGGWLSDGAAGLFARYVDRVIERFGDRLTHVVTFNEPDLPRMLQWANLPPIVAELERATLEGAARSAGVDRYRAANVVLVEDMDAMEDGQAAAHLAAKAAIKKRFPHLQVGLSIAMVDDVVVGDDPSVRDRKRAEVYQRWLELARDDDFIGVQNYERLAYDGDGLVVDPAAAEGDFMNSPKEPRSLAECVRYAHEVSGVPVFVTEHGIQTEDDEKRYDFTRRSLKHLLDVIDEDVPVLGYLHWTLMDNFEWVFGYGPKFGLVAVDRETFERTPKPTAELLGQVAQDHGIPHPEPVSSDARVLTDRAGRYGKQLASHLGRKAKSEWDEEAGRGSIVFADGRGRAELVAEEDALALSLAADEDIVETLEGVLGRHLVRFGSRDELAVAWTRSDGSAGSEQRFEESS